MLKELVTEIIILLYERQNSKEIWVFFLRF